MLFQESGRIEEIRSIGGETAKLLVRSGPASWLVTVVDPDLDAVRRYGRRLIGHSLHFSGMVVGRPDEDGVLHVLGRRVGLDVADLGVRGAGA